MNALTYRKIQRAQEFAKLSSEIRRKLRSAFPREEIEQREEITYSKVNNIIKEVKHFAKKWNKSVKDVSLLKYVHNNYDGFYESKVDMAIKAVETDEQYYARLMEAYNSNMFLYVTIPSKRKKKKR
jgi:hypothetical protein